MAERLQKNYNNFFFQSSGENGPNAQFYEIIGHLESSGFLIIAATAMTLTRIFNKGEVCYSRKKKEV